MRPYAISLATLGWLCLASATNCMADANLTLYGRLDNGIEYVNGMRVSDGARASRWRAQSGDWGTAMLGLRGTETLNADLNVIFNLESALDTMTGRGGGAPAYEFNRYASVGLRSQRYGTVQFGRMLWISNGVWDFDPFVQEAWSSASLVRGRNWPQTSNNIDYRSPTFAGFDLQLRMALGNQSNFNLGPRGDFGRSSGAQLTYTTQKFQIRAIYDELRDAQGRFSDLFRASKEYAAMFNIFLGNVKLQAAYTHMYASDTALPGAPSAADHEWFAIDWRVSPIVDLTLGGFHINANGHGDRGGGSATIYEAGGIYRLSKRTFFYATMAQARNSSSAAFGLAALPYDSAEQALAGQTQTGFYAGINHSF